MRKREIHKRATARGTAWKKKKKKSTRQLRLPRLARLHEQGSAPEQTSKYCTVQYNEDCEEQDMPRASENKNNFPTRERAVGLLRYFTKRSASAQSVFRRPTCAEETMTHHETVSLSLMAHGQHCIRGDQVSCTPILVNLKHKILANDSNEEQHGARQIEDQYCGLSPA